MTVQTWPSPKIPCTLLAPDVGRNSTFTPESRRPKAEGRWRRLHLLGPRWGGGFGPVAVALVWWVVSGCPRPAVPGVPAPAPTPPPADVAPHPEEEDVASRPPEVPPPAQVDTPPLAALDPEGPRVGDRRFQPFGSGVRPPEGAPPTIVPTLVPEGDREEPPELGAEALSAIRAQFGCEVLEQLSWPASWLSPYGVVLRCCNPLSGRPASPDAFHAGCATPLQCALLIDEGMGAISKIETVTALRQRLAPLRDPRTALAVVDATVRDVVPFFGDRPEETAFLLEGSWRYLADTVTGTRVVQRLGEDGGYEVTTFVVPQCGCRHDFIEVRFLVDVLAGVTEQSRRTLAEDTSGVCVE